jgi:AcrR family transcriptional regulator
MPAKQPPRARKRPKQSRSLFAVQAIREACLKILETEGAGKLTTQRIADVAGVNIASVYQYFPNKEAILTDVYEGVMLELEEQAGQSFCKIQALADRSLPQALAAIVDMECEQLLVLQRLNPGFFGEYQHSFDIHQRVNELTKSLSNPSWEEWLESWLRDQDCGGHPRLRGVLLRQTLQGNLHMVLQEQPELLRDNEYRRELVHLLLRYLEVG